MGINDSDRGHRFEYEREDRTVKYLSANKSIYNFSKHVFVLHEQHYHTLERGFGGGEGNEVNNMRDELDVY